MGLAPTTPEGKEIFFIGLDDWTGVAECILNVIDPGFPFSAPPWKRGPPSSWRARFGSDWIAARVQNPSNGMRMSFSEIGTATAEEREAMVE